MSGAATEARFGAKSEVDPSITALHGGRLGGNPRDAAVYTSVYARLRRQDANKLTVLPVDS